MRLSLITICLFLSFVVSDQREITIDDFTTRDTFAQATVSGINWMADGKYYTSLRSNKVVKYDVTTGAEIEVIFDGKSNEIGSYSFSKNERKLLLAAGVENIYRRSYIGHR